MKNDVTLQAIEALLEQINSLVIDASRNDMKDTWKNLNDAASALYLAKRSVRREQPA